MAVYRKGCRPDYYDRFRCIAGACKDSCCIGWEIDVDDEKKEYYRNLSGELGERLNTGIDWKEGHFILQGKEERCPFLNKENLCDLMMGLGEEGLCDICREHPRFYDWFDGYTEVGLGLCCEEAARLLLESEKKLEFLADPYIDEEPWINVLFSARETAFRILQDRSYPIWDRIYTFSAYIEELQECMDFGSMEEAEETAVYYRENPRLETWNKEHAGQKKLIYEAILQACTDLEPIDEAWPEVIRRLQDFVQSERQLMDAERKLTEQYGHLDYHYEHLAVYFTYRYFMKSREDSHIRSKGMLAMFCILLIRLMDLWEISKTGSISAESRAWNAKNCSKEIEYSEENLAKLDRLFEDSDMEAFYGIF